MSAQSRALTGGVAGALVLHAAAAAAFLTFRTTAAPPLPPVYRVQLFAAPPAEERSIGVVQPTAPVVTGPTVAPTVKRQQVTPTPAIKGRRPPPVKQVTEVPKPAVDPGAPSVLPPLAAGGPTGGRGADAAALETGGAEFPYPTYLKNIVNQIISRFQPRVKARLVARVRFLIRRDGTVPIESIQLDQTSGMFSFNQDALAAVEAAARANGFGPLPKGFPEDVLPVVFRFDPAVVR
ncbi:MAG: TonB C-terminal domain-containing protein [Gemmatirosa sp.]|nr:TonB C-terminal domain-containing protein [Gemmatirosa sp.]